jgi:cytochrome c553
LGLALALPASADDGRGEALFDLCTQCHGNAGEGKQNIEAPAIAGLPAWYVSLQLENFRSGARATHFDDIQGMRMRPMALSLTREGDVENVAAYVAALPITSPPITLEGGDAAKGKNLYMLCASCHGIDGTGSEPQGGPPMIGQSDWYLLTQLEKYKAGVRGRDPRDAFGLMMQPMSLTLPDEQAMKDVIAHMMTLNAN